MRRFVLVIVILLFSSAVLYASIYDEDQYVTSTTNRHNLSMYSSSSIRAVNEKQICIFCHTPHNSSSQAPLWNHTLTTATYTYYWTATMNAYSSPASAPVIDGYSQLCLSCHDGTVALGAVNSRITTYGEGPRGTPIKMETGSGFVDSNGKLLSGAAGYVGTDLSGNHPISFQYTQALAESDGFLTIPDADGIHLNGDPDVKLYPSQGGYGVQCTSCHDPHDDSTTDPTPPFWKKATYDEVCDVCHTI